jgi:hypothetical protein
MKCGFDKRDVVLIAVNSPRRLANVVFESVPLTKIFSLDSRYYACELCSLVFLEHRVVPSFHITTGLFLESKLAAELLPG